MQDQKRTLKRPKSVPYRAVRLQLELTFVIRQRTTEIISDQIRTFFIHDKIILIIPKFPSVILF